ncbi:hypothetical protein Ddc_24647 [Ditylenchus destructor]|nr:hypothetical protein Ddc_24647 [Ditylenchus destructor]
MLLGIGGQPADQQEELVAALGVAMETRRQLEAGPDTRLARLPASPRGAVRGLVDRGAQRVARGQRMFMANPRGGADGLEGRDFALEQSVPHLDLLLAEGPRQIRQRTQQRLGRFEQRIPCRRDGRQALAHEPPSSSDALATPAWKSSAPNAGSLFSSG